MKMKFISKESLVHAALITLLFALSIQVTTAQPPVLLSATASEDGSTVTAVFNEPVDEVVAEDTFNYTITSSDGSFINVLAATLAADQQTLTLIVAPSLMARVSYTLIAANICDITFECSSEQSVPIAFESIPPNRPPVANSQSVIVHANTPAPITLTGSDPDGDLLTFVITSSPTRGALSGTPPNVTYTPQSGYLGPDSFTFKVNDSITDSAPATVSIEVRTLLVATGSVWKYLDTGIDPGTAWIDPFYDDTSWLMGPSELGFGDFDEATVIRSGTFTEPIITAYFRHAFTVADLSTIGTLSLQLWRDDGAIVYLNGVEVLRDNMPGGSITYSTLAIQRAPDDGRIPVTAQLGSSLLVNGANLIAVEVHQDSRATNADLSFNLHLDASAPPPDPPDLVSAVACGSVVTATFDEALTESSATDPFSYIILGSDGSSIAVLLAALQSDQQTVTLIVNPSTPFLPGISYTLEASKICDPSGDCLSQASVPLQFDTTPPTVTCHVAVNTLFPPNDFFIDVGLTATASEGNLQLRVFSDEPELSGATDATFDDGVLRLRARRFEEGDGRVYLIVVTATDACGNIGACCKTVVVPHDLSNAALDSVNAQAAAAEAQCSPQGASSTPYEILP